MSGGQYVAAAYGVVLVFVTVYVAIIAAKLQRLQRDVRELLERAGREPGGGRSARTDVYAAGVPSMGPGGEEGA